MAIGWTPEGVPTGQLQLEGPTLNVQLHYASLEVSVLKKAGVKVNPPEDVTALVDTGASSSAIDIDVARKMGLLTRAYIMVNTPSPGGPQSHPVFSASMNFLEIQFKAIDAIGLIGVDIKQQSIGCLLGRDFLSKVVMIYDGPKGKITIAQ